MEYMKALHVRSNSGVAKDVVKREKYNLVTIVERKAETFRFSHSPKEDKLPSVGDSGRLESNAGMTGTKIEVEI